jgi:hypothetical protein
LFTGAAVICRDIDEPLGYNLHFMLVVRNKGDRDSSPWVEGLVLQPTGKARGQFQRHRTIDINSNPRDLVDDFLRLNWENIEN